MSALEEYRQKRVRLGVYGRIHPLDIIRPADAAIAELEAERDALRTVLQNIADEATDFADAVRKGREG